MTKMIQPGMVYDPVLDESELSEERRLVLERVGKNKAVLEIGAHTGYFSERLRNAGCTVTAVEMDPVAAKKAESRVDRIIVGDIEDPKVFGQITETFEVILFMHVLEHFVDPWRMLRESRKLLRPGGTLIVLLPNVGAWCVRKALFFHGAFEYEDVGIMDRTHLRFFTMYSAQALLRDSGYRVVFWSPIDICVPLERRLRLLPVVGMFSRVWAAWMAGRFPNLCSEILLFQAEISGAER
jgi:SAM-dependent methyltransferase